MRRLISPAFFVVAALTAAAAHAQTVDELVARNLEAKGGAEKWNSIQSVRMTGKVTIQGMEAPLIVYAKRPNYNRQEITIKGVKIVQAFDGTTAWVINPLTGTETPQPLPAAATETMKSSVDFDGALIGYKNKGHTVELVGKETVDGKDAYHLKVTMKNGHVQHYYLDAQSGIEVKTSADVDVGTGQKQTLASEMSNYKPVNGIMIPHTVTQSMNGKPLTQMIIDKVELNSSMDDDLFRMPANQGPAQK